MEILETILQCTKKIKIKKPKQTKKQTKKNHQQQQQKLPKTARLKNLSTKSLQIIYLINMQKQDLQLNNLQWLICHKTKPNQIICIKYICIKRIWHLITYKGWYAIKPNSTY